MAAIDFPNSPAIGDLFTQGDITWQWDGTVWRGLGTTATGPAGVTISDDEPESNQVLWLDTDEDPDVPVPAGGSAGQLLAKIDSTDYNTAWVTQEGYRIAQTLYFTSSGTFTKATYPWLRAVKVKCQGAGGGSGGIPATTAGQKAIAVAGYGGGYAESFITDISGLDASVTVTVGAGGAGGSAGANAGAAGGASSFGSPAIVSGDGGSAGAAGAVLTASNVFNPSTSTSGGVGDLVVFGDSPEVSFVINVSDNNNQLGGSGGSSFLGTGGGAQRNGSGSNALLHGGGGGAPANNVSQAARAGGNGAAGIVILELYG
jgi:hypothetical protein